MAGIFNRAYDQADRMLNGSGLSSIVYRQGGGSTIGRGLKSAYQRLPSTAKFYLQQFQDKPMTDKEVKETLTESEINELNKAIELNQAAPKGGEIEIISRKGEPTGFFEPNPTIPGPVKDKEGNILFDPEGEVTWRTPGYASIDYTGISDFFPGNPLFNLQNTLGKFYYGPANLAGEREIYDRYDWKNEDPEGLLGALKRGDLKWFLENTGKAYQDYKGREGRPISFTVNPYKDQWKFNPKTGEYIYPEGQGPSQQNTGEDHSLSSLEGYSEETSPSGVTTSFIDDMAIDTTSGLKHGGQTMPRGLSGINKTININGQPHSLAWINPGEASALKAMGGSGKKVGGVPAYFYIAEGEEYEDVVVGPTGESPTEYDYMVGAVEGPPAKSTGLVDLGHQEIAKRWSEMIGQDIQQDLPLDHPERKLGLTPTRSQQKDVAHRVAQNLNPEFDRGFDLESFAEKYPWFAPFALPIKGAGWLMGRDPNPVVSTVNIKGVTYNLHMDGTLSEQRKDEDYGDDGNEPVKKKFPLKKIAAAGKEEEKELTGIAKLLDEREDKPTKGEALQPQFDNIVAAGFSRQEAADMLNQPVNIFA